MKQLFLILLFSIAIVSHSNAQDAPKKSTKAIIQFENKTDALTSLLEIFSDKGFQIKTIDKELGILTTEAKGNNRFQSKYNVLVNSEGIAKLTGLMTIGSITIYGVEDDSWSSIENKGMKGSPIRKSWMQLEEIAKETGREVSYE